MEKNAPITSMIFRTPKPPSAGDLKQPSVVDRSQRPMVRREGCILSNVTDQPQIRVSDSDREEYSQTLRDGYVAGRLTESELEERLSSAYAATSRSDLEPLVADLPSQPSAPVPATAQPVSSPLARYVLPFFPAFICTAIWAFTNFGGYFWPAWVFLGIGIATISKALKQSDN